LSFNQPRFVFNSAGVEPQPLDRTTIDFMKTKGIDLSRSVPKAIHQIPNLEYYQTIVALTPNAHKLFPQQLRKTIFLDWPVEDPSLKQGDSKAITAAYEEVYQYIQSQVNDIIKAIIGTENG
jgi:protein-tyrosine-phosphatase